MQHAKKSIICVFYEARLSPNHPFGGESLLLRILERYAATPERQDVARRAVAMRLVLFGEYLSSLDRWAMGKGPW